MPCIGNVQAQLLEMSADQVLAFAASAASVMCALTGMHGVKGLSSEQARFVADHNDVDAAAG